MFSKKLVVSVACLAIAGLASPAHAGSGSDSRTCALGTCSVSVYHYTYSSGGNVYHYCSASVSGAPLFTGTLTCTGGPSDGCAGLAGGCDLGSDGWTPLAGWCMTFSATATVTSAVEGTTASDSFIDCG
jgi:hypothetical protein